MAKRKAVANDYGPDDGVIATMEIVEEDDDRVDEGNELEAVSEKDGAVEVDADGTEPPNTIPSGHFTRELKCKLDDEEVAAKAAEMTQALYALDAIEWEFKGVKDDYKGRIATAECDFRALARVVSQRSEFREVECCEERLDDTHRINILRLDTFQIVESREMTSAELQRSLFPEPEARVIRKEEEGKTSCGKSTR